MKKNRFTEFFKGKGYYVLLFVGVVAIAAVAVIGSQLSSKQNQDQNFVDLNEADDNIAADEDDTQLAENNPVSEGIANSEGDAGDDTATNENPAQEVVTNDDLIEYAEYSNEETADSKQVQQPAQTTEVAKEQPEAVETTGKQLKAEEKKAQETLSFKADDGLLWPVNGNVIMNYSMDHTIYHATLMQYKCNPAIIIDAEVGTEVKAAATGIVTAIEPDNEETGLTVTMDIGDGYSVVYGQLANVNLKVGDTVKAGKVIGTIAEPTKYYTMEGSNLYFMVMEDDQTINPMLLLK